jgi:signal peptide peptidase SppA
MVVVQGSRQYQHVAAAVFRQPWAILPEKLAAIGELVAMRIDGLRADPAHVAAIVAAAREAEVAHAAAAGPQRSKGMTAVLPLTGTLLWRSGPMEQMSGAVSLQQWGQAFDAAMNDDRIKSIVIDVDSPGGTVDGVPETAAKVFAARGRKPVTAVVNTLAASAAYWIATAASELVITPSGMAGSVGVYVLHEDDSAAVENAGVRFTFIEAPQGGHKTEGNPFAPLSEESAAHYQGMVNELYGQFVADVAKHRGVTEAAVRSDYGQGRVLLAKDALRARMVDRVATLEQVLQRHGGGDQAVGASPAAEGTSPEFTLEDQRFALDLALAAAEAERLTREVSG